MASKGTTVTVTVAGATISAAPGPAPLGTAISGAPWEFDQGYRLLGALIQKARKTGAGAAWLWLEDAGALWPLSQFAHKPLREKIVDVLHVAEPLFEAHPHIIGIVVCSDELRINGSIGDETVQYGAGLSAAASSAKQSSCTPVFSSRIRCS